MRLADPAFVVAWHSLISWMVQLCCGCSHVCIAGQQQLFITTASASAVAGQQLQVICSEIANTIAAALARPGLVPASSAAGAGTMWK